MLEQETIDQTTTNRAAAIVFASKKDGSSRFCYEYKKLNAGINETVTTVHEWALLSTPMEYPQYFPHLMLQAGIACEIGQNDKNKTAFTYRKNLCQSTKMLFVLKSTPTTFQWTTDVVLATVKWRSTLVHLDNIVIFSKTHKWNIA